MAATVLSRRGCSPRAGTRCAVLSVGDPARLKGDAALAAKKWDGAVAAATPDALAGAGLVIDALFGAGLDRPVEGLAARDDRGHECTGFAGRRCRPAERHQWNIGRGDGRCRERNGDRHFFPAKTGPPSVAGAASLRAGDRADIGIPASVLARIAPRTFENVPKLWRPKFPVPRHDAHKYDRGHAVVVSGPSWSTGAARLAARGALRAGAGLVTIASPREALAINAAASLAVMVRPVDGAAELAEFLADRRLNALAIGPGVGVGEATCELVLAALSGDRAVVLDADAITSFAQAPERLANAINARGPQVTLLTPHEGEFSRYFGALDPRTQTGSKLERARLAAELTGATVLLKGADTVVATAGGRASIAANAPAYLATAGAGDVLAGIATGLLAQGMPVFEAASVAVWLHGEAAIAFGPGLISEDLAETLPHVYKALLA